MRVLVFNGWAAGPETWALTTFRRDWTFSYIEQMDGLPEQVADTLDGPLLLVGFSMGGMFAQKLFLRDPERVCGLVLVSSTPRMLEDRNAGWNGMSERRLEAFRFGTKLIFRSDPSPVYDPAAMDRGLECLRHTDLRSELERYVASDACRSRPPLPVFVVHSERDGIVRPQNAAYFKSVFPQAEVTMVPGAEHDLPITAPELVDHAVSRCLELANPQLTKWRRK